MAKIDTSSSFENAQPIEVAADAELHLDDGPMTREPATTDPIDIFGDLGMTGQGDLERGMVPDVMYDFALDSSQGTTAPASAGAFSALTRRFPLDRPQPGQWFA